MNNSTLLEALEPQIRRKAREFLVTADAHGFHVKVTCTRRALTEQARLYRQGRSLPEIEAKASELSDKWHRPDLGKILMGVGPQFSDKMVTHAGPGQSMHNYGLAFDIVPIIAGRAVYDDTSPEGISRWDSLGRLGEHCGLEWGGRWPYPKTDRPHLQVQGGDWEDLIATWSWNATEKGN